VGRFGLFDEGNGLIYIRARYYNPAQGRFISKDPKPGSDTDTQSLNRFVYGMNNPVRFVDVSGYSRLEACQAETTKGASSDIDNNWMLDSDRLYSLLQFGFSKLADAPNWKIVSRAGYFTSTGKYVPPGMRVAPGAVKIGADKIGMLAGPVVQVIEDSYRDDLSGSQRIGRQSIATLEAIPGLGYGISLLDFGASMIFGPEKVNQFKSDIFSNKNPIVDKGSDFMRLVGGKGFDNWLQNQNWLDAY
jgi:RHS repeat-associated protein